MCRAGSPELAVTSISLKDLQAARNRRRRELRRELTSRRSLVDVLTHPEVQLRTQRQHWVDSPLPTAYSNRPSSTVPPEGAQIPPSLLVGTAKLRNGPVPTVGAATTAPT